MEETQAEQYARTAFSLLSTAKREGDVMQGIGFALLGLLSLSIENTRRVMPMVDEAKDSFKEAKEQLESLKDKVDGRRSDL